MRAETLPSSIDTTHYYTSKEIRDLPEPAAGWDAFYNGIDTLEYPAEAKKRRLQSLLTVAYRIDEKGTADSVYIQSFTKSGKWKRCVPCETQIIHYFSQTQWKPGAVRGTAVKSEGDLLIKYSIYDPTIKEPEHFMGW